MATAEQLREATMAAAKDADVVVMAAAVADFRPARPAAAKIKKTDAAPEPVELAGTIRRADRTGAVPGGRRAGRSR